MLRTICRSLSVAAVAVALTLPLAGASNAQKWERLAPFPEGSEELYGIAAGGKLHVFGGLAPGWRPKALHYSFDPEKNAWEKHRNIPLPSHHLPLATIDGKIYMFGGFRLPDSGPPSWVPINNTWEYDTATDQWRELAPMPTARGSANAVVVDGKIYVIGGAGLHPGSKETAAHPARPHRALGTVEVYDPKTDTWETRNPMPTARNHAAAGAVDGKIYVIGGRVGSAFITRASNTDVVEVYDPETDQWGALLAPMAMGPRSATAWATHNGRIYVAGGESRSGQANTTFRRVEVYEPASNSWSALPPMLFHRHGLAGDVLNGRLHVVSGNMQSGGGPGAHVETDVHEVITLK